MHVSNQAGEAEDVTTLCHSGSDWCTETDRTGGSLRLSRNEDLQDIVPVDVDVGINALWAVVGSGVDNESVIGMNISLQSQYCCVLSEAPSYQAYLALSTA